MIANNETQDDKSVGVDNSQSSYNGDKNQSDCHDIITRAYDERDISEMVDIWNEVVLEGNAFPQADPLTIDSARSFFGKQTYCGVAFDSASGKVLGLYILHPNGEGHCAHICNASYAVKSGVRGRHIGRALVIDCLKVARERGFLILCFNAVVKSNIAARHLYESLGFTVVGEIERGYKKDDGEFLDILLYKRDL